MDDKKGVGMVFWDVANENSGRLPGDDVTDNGNGTGSGRLIVMVGARVKLLSDEDVVVSGNIDEYLGGFITRMNGGLGNEENSSMLDSVLVMILSILGRA